MPFRVSVQEHASLARYLFKCVVLTVPVGLFVGSACALILWSLDEATAARLRHPRQYIASKEIGLFGAACKVS